jgi:hypothetical protein
MDERVVLSFQWKEVIQDLIVYDKDRETLLDLILDWEAECVKWGKEMPLQPRFFYMYNNEVQWLDWDDDLFKMFSKFSMGEMIVVYVMEVEAETKLMNYVRSLKKLQDPNQPQPLNVKVPEEPIELSNTDPSPFQQEVELDHHQMNPTQSEQSQNYPETQQCKSISFRSKLTIRRSPRFDVPTTQQPVVGEYNEEQHDVGVMNATEYKWNEMECVSSPVNL